MATDVVEEKDFSQPIIRRRKLTAVNEATMRTVIDVEGTGTMVTDEPERNGGTNTGPTPLTSVVAALCGCESVTFHRTAAEMGFAYSGITFDADFTIDIRGRDGDRSVRPHFQTVRMEATVTTEETADRLAEVVAETEARCPVFNLLKDAQVRIETVWIRRSPGA
jgi:uncharacterized OsmC-like protein